MYSVSQQTRPQTPLSRNASLTAEGSTAQSHHRGCSAQTCLAPTDRPTESNVSKWIDLPLPVAEAVRRTAAAAEGNPAEGNPVESSPAGGNRGPVGAAAGCRNSPASGGMRPSEREGEPDNSEAEVDSSGELTLADILMGWRGEG